MIKLGATKSKGGRLRSPSAAIAVTAIFSAMAVAITLTKLTIPFPPLPYLKIDFSEVPVTVAMLLMGPVYGFLSSVIYWLVLTMRAGDFLGPAMKFAAVSSMIVGFWVASVVYGRVARRKSFASMMVTGFLLGSLFRVVVMSVFNYFVLLYIAPYYVDFIAPLLATIGLPAETTLDVVIWSLLFTAVYNVIHSAVSVFPAYILTKASLERIPGIIGGAWIREFLDE
jgi:riboflavin transporter FmnP